MKSIHNFSANSCLDITVGILWDSLHFALAQFWYPTHGHLFSNNLQLGMDESNITFINSICVFSSAIMMFLLIDYYSPISSMRFTFSNIIVALVYSSKA